MNFQHIIPDKSVSLFVKTIMFFEETGNNLKTILPFFADGYPGLVYYEAKKPVTALPHDKKMPAFFLYGQTLNHMQLVFESSYRMIVFQFYPFILKSFFNITPKTINDDCYDLLQQGNAETKAVLQQLQKASMPGNQVQIITAFLYATFLVKIQSLDAKLKQGLQEIIDKKGQVAINELCQKIKINERSFERRFSAETGISPKQFAKIIQFQSSLEQLSVKDFNKLTDIVYENGYVDQSHFIKVFKSFTGKTPGMFTKK